VFPPSDFRYLLVRASGVSRIDGATVSTAPSPARLIERHGTIRRTSFNPTRLVLDLGCRNVPVDQLYLSAATPRYNRAATVEGSNDGRNWSELARAPGCSVSHARSRRRSILRRATGTCA